MKEKKTNIAEELTRSVRRQIITTILTLILLILITTGFVLYGMGYRLNFFAKNTPILAHTGILNAQSTPTGAQVWVDGHLTTATNNTVNLTPDKYTITVVKDGYLPWKKDVMIEDQVVSNVEARLFPQAPTLQSISSVGISDPVLDPSGTKLAFTIASQSATKNGIYVLNMTSQNFPVLPLQSSSTQIADESTGIPFSQAQISWSPDGQQIIASVSATPTQPATVYQLQANQLNATPQDITATLPSVEANWQTLENQQNKARLASLKPAVRQLLTHFNIISYSPDGTKILYQAKNDYALPIIIKPRRIGNNLLYEQRNIQKNSIYVYDITEDVNTRVLDYSPVACNVTNKDCHVPLTWFPDSFHLVYVYDKKIDILEDDGSNMTTIYAGPFVGNYAFPWPDGSKLVILTNLGNTSIQPTLYTIGLQ